MKNLSLIVVLVLVNYLHSSTAFAMESEVVGKATEGIVGNIERFLKGGQKGNLDNRELEKAAEGRGGSFQQLASFFGSRSTTASPSSNAITSVKSQSNLHPIPSDSITVMEKKESSFTTPEKRPSHASNISDTASESSRSQSVEDSPPQNSDAAANVRISEGSCSSISTEKSLAEVETMSADRTLPLTITRDMLHETILQAEATSKYASDTINIIKNIYDMIHSKKDHAKDYIFSNVWKKIVTAKDATVIAQKNIEVSLLRMDDLSLGPQAFYAVDAPLFIALDLAMETVQESVEEALAIIEKIKEDPLYCEDKEALNLLQRTHTEFTKFLDSTNSQTKLIANELLTFSDFSPKQDDFKIALRQAKAATVCAVNTRQTVHILFDWFNGGEFANNNNLNDLSAACKALDAASIIVTTVEKRVQNRLAQLGSSSYDKALSDGFSLNNAKLFRYQKVATTNLKEAIERVYSIAERVKNYPWEEDTDELLEELAKIHTQFSEDCQSECKD